MLLFEKTLAVKHETTHKSAKLPTNHPNHPQTIHKPARSQQNYPKTTQIFHEPVTNQPNHPQSSHNHSIISRKTVFYVTKNFSNNEKHV